MKEATTGMCLHLYLPPPDHRRGGQGGGREGEREGKEPNEVGRTHRFQGRRRKSPHWTLMWRTRQ